MRLTGNQEFEEVIVPPAKPVPPRETERLISVSELDDLCRDSFPVMLHTTYLDLFLTHSIGLFVLKQDTVNRLPYGVWDE